MKKLIIVVALFVVIGSIYLLMARGKDDAREGRKIMNADQAIALIKEQNPELKAYPSDNLPPRLIEVEESQNGWQVGFYTEGSGRPGILMAKCYLVSNSGNVTLSGEFSAGQNDGPSKLDLSTCKAT